MNHLLIPLSGIRDNHTRGTAGGFPKERIGAGRLLSVVSAYFTIYAAIPGVLIYKDFFV